MSRARCSFQLVGNGFRSCGSLRQPAARGLSAIKDRLIDVRRQERQPQQRPEHPRSIRSAAAISLMKA
jgi:hypothetical protein